MYKNKGGASRGLTNSDYTTLYALGFDDGDVEMIEFYNHYASVNDVIAEFIRVANEEYNMNIDNIQVIAESTSDQLPNSNVSKRDIAREVVFYYANEGRMNGGRRRRQRKSTNKTRIRRTRTHKNRRIRKKN